MKGDRLTVEEAAPLLGMTPNFIRYQMRKGNLQEIGVAVKGTGKQYRYIIYKPLVERFTGRTNGCL